MARKASAPVVLFVALITAVFLPVGPARALPGASAERASAIERMIAEDLFARTNDERTLRGLAPLQWDPSLAYLASDWAHVQVEGGTSVHRPDLAVLHRSAPWNLRRLLGVGENIWQAVAGLHGSGFLHLQWMRSEAHRANILGAPYDTMGVGVACHGDRIFAVENFGIVDFAAFGPTPPEEPIARPVEDGPLCTGTAATASGLVHDLAPRPATGGRVYGPSRIHTAVSASRSAYSYRPGGILVARADEPADAVAAATIAASQLAPLLLTWPTELPPETVAEISRLRGLEDRGLGDLEIFILGGEAAVSAAVEQQLRDLGLPVVRLAGLDRHATAAAVSRAATPVGPGRVLVASGHVWQDALAAANLVAFDSWLLTVSHDTVPEATREALETLAPDQAIDVVASDGSIADEVLAELDTLSGEMTVHRAATAPELAARLAGQRVDTVDGRAAALIASADTFADALAASAALPAAAIGSVGVLLLTPFGSPPAQATLDVTRRPEIADLWFLGGAAALTDAVVDAIGDSRGPLPDSGFLPRLDSPIRSVGAQASAASSSWALRCHSDMRSSMRSRIQGGGPPRPSPRAQGGPPWPSPSPRIQGGPPWPSPRAHGGPPPPQRARLASIARTPMPISGKRNGGGPGGRPPWWS